MDASCYRQRAVTKFTEPVNVQGLRCKTLRKIRLKSVLTLAIQRRHRPRKRQHQRLLSAPTFHNVFAGGNPAATAAFRSRKIENKPVSVRCPSNCALPRRCAPSRHRLLARRRAQLNISSNTNQWSAIKNTVLPVPRLLSSRSATHGLHHR